MSTATSVGINESNTLIVFSFGSYPIRVAGTRREPLFCVADLCVALALGNPAMATANHPEEEKGISLTDTLGGVQQMVCVTEPGLYRLIFRSRKPKAEEFRQWVFREVLPALRQTGAYVIPAPAAGLDEVGRTATFLNLTEQLIRLGSTVTKAGNLALKWLPHLRPGWQLPGLATGGGAAARDLSPAFLDILDGATWDRHDARVTLWDISGGKPWEGTAAELRALIIHATCDRAQSFRELLLHRIPGRLMARLAESFPDRVAYRRTKMARLWIITPPFALHTS